MAKRLHLNLVSRLALRLAPLLATLACASESTPGDATGGTSPGGAAGAGGAAGLGGSAGSSAGGTAGSGLGGTAGGGAGSGGASGAGAGGQAGSAGQAGGGGQAGSAGQAGGGGQAGSAGQGGTAGQGGQGGSSGQGGSGGSAVCDAPNVIFKVSCMGMDCHATSHPEAGLDLEAPNVAERIRDKDADPNHECPGEGKVIDVANPDASLMLTKLNEPPPCGERMPNEMMDELTASEKQCIRDWVLWVVANP